ncbi:hypothetical protein BS47DRAFT_1374501 [Hydnum rufescens UP504]|uniref:Aldehyde dehydrogenase domain-containing protein n=1 Tax=Hydnum rufescens UP504 TaxID=1448309 RepID=A0A9P6AC79_9AGAM|nr:hypothetical protein BS47DRAFT_1374501 [Hydnum rufescens UP504]
MFMLSNLFQASFLNYEAIVIQNPCLHSHRLDSRLGPPSALPGYDYITCYDPATGVHLGILPADPVEDIMRKVELAKRAQLEWSQSSFSDRRRVLRSLLAWLVREQEIFARVACRDTGKTSVGSVLLICIHHGERALRPERRRSNLLLSYNTSVIHYEPLGVAAAITSWSYALHNAFSPVIAAIFAGNAVVLKCFEYVVWSSRFYLGALRECLYTCGWDPDIVQHAEALTTSPDIKHITFVGSTGGKDPAIILRRTNIKKWSSVWMRGAFQSMGQNYEFIAEMSERIRKLCVGFVLTTSPEGFISVVDGGSMINDSYTHFDGLKKVIQDAVAMGAHLVTGGPTLRHPYHESGSYFAPSLLGNVSSNMEIAQSEVFAPIILAVDIANGTRYGLGASVFGPDQQTCKGVTLALECGMVSVHDFDLPFGGIKASGYGRFGGREGLRALTYTKAVIVDPFPLIAETFQRRLIQSWEFMSGLVAFVRGDQ